LPPALEKVVVIKGRADRRIHRENTLRPVRAITSLRRSTQVENPTGSTRFKRRGADRNPYGMQTKSHHLGALKSKTRNGTKGKINKKEKSQGLPEHKPSEGVDKQNSKRRTFQTPISEKGGDLKIRKAGVEGKRDGTAVSLGVEK